MCVRWYWSSKERVADVSVEWIVVIFEPVLSCMKAFYGAYLMP